MAIRESRGHWVVEFQQGGKRIFRRLPAGITKAQAQALETKIRRELFDRDELGVKEDITLQGAIGLWLANNRRKNQKQALSEAKQWEGMYDAKTLLKEAPDVAERAIALWSRPRIVKDAADQRDHQVRGTRPTTAITAARPSTINRRLCILKAAAKYCYKKGLIQENVSGRITLLRERGRQIFLTKQEVRALANASSCQRTACAIWIAAYTGLRASELLALPATKSRAASLTISESKTGKPRVVPVAEPARRYLSALPLGLSYWQLHDGFLAARKKAGLPKEVTFHTLRHTCASWLINEGVDLYTVGKILGHSSPLTTQRYAHLVTGTLKKAMARLR